MADNPLLGTFWASAGSLNLELKKRARLKVVSSNALVYTDGLAHHNNRITIGEDAVLDAYLTDKNDGALMYHHDDLVVDVQKNGQLLIQTTKATPFTKASSINLGPGAKADLKTFAVISSTQEMARSRLTMPTSYRSGLVITVLKVPLV